MVRRVILITILLIAACFSAAVNYTVTLVQGKNTSVVLTTTSVTATDMVAGNPVITGVGDISFKVDGVTLGTLTGIPFTKVEFSSAFSTHNIMHGFMVTLPSDQTLPNLFGTGFSLTATKGSTITFNYTLQTGAGGAAFQGGATVTMPYKDSSGGTVALTVGQFNLNSDGSTSGSGTITVPKLGIELPVATITSAAGPDNWSYSRPAGGSLQFAASFSTVTANFSIPGLDTLDPSPLNLTVTGLNVDTEGGISFDKATLTPGAPLKIALPAPVNAELTVSSVSASMKQNMLQNFNMVSSLTLPNSFSAVDPSTGASPLPVTIPNVSLSFNNQGIPNISVGALASKLDIFWNGFGIHIPAIPNVPPFELDLDKNFAYADEKDASNKPYPASWEGIYIRSATFTLPPSFGAGQEIAVQNFGIGTTGVSGTVSWTFGANSPLNLNVPGFAGRLLNLSVTFQNNQVVAGAAKGLISCPDWNIALNAGISFSSTGATTVTVSTTQPVQIPSLGVALQIDQGTATYDGKGKGTLTLTGSISLGDNPPGGFSSLADATFSISNLKIDSQGHVSFTSAWLDLPNAQPISVGPVTATINQIGIGQNANNGPWWISFTGDVGFQGLPVSGQLGFNNLTITQGVNGALPTISFPGINLDVDIEGVASLDVDLDHSTYPIAGQKPAMPDWQAYNGPPIDIYSGTVSASLECFGSGGPGFSLSFLGSKDGWFVMGSVPIPGGIVLGETPFSLFGFTGGFGYNVEPDTPGATGIPTVNYNLIPVAPGAPGNDIFVAGVTLGTSDGFTLWGDLTLILDIGSDFQIDLNGQLYFLQAGITDPVGTAPQDRVISGNIVFVMPGGVPTLAASATANFYLPDNATYNNNKVGVYATGSLWFYVDPTGVTLWVGGQITPADLGQGTAPSIQNPVTVYLMGTQGPAGAINVKYPAPSGVYPIQAAATFSFSKSVKGSVNIGIGTINASASLSIDAWFWGAVTLPPSAAFSVQAGLGCSGNGNFKITGPFSTNFKASLAFSGLLTGVINSGGASVSGDLDISVNVCGCNPTISLSASWP